MSAEHRAKISAAQKGKKRGPMVISHEREMERRRKIAAALLGRPLSPEHRAKLSAARSGRKLSEEHRRKFTLSRLGKKNSDEMRRKISAANKGQKPSALCIERSREARKNGLNLSDEARRKKSEQHRGAKHHAWKGGVTPENLRIRALIDMKLWREAVFKRDNFTCQECDVRGGDLHAHHIKPFCRYPDLRFEVSNGLTLCEPCHVDHHRGWRADKEAA